jgi:hypothetical protein
VNKLTRRGHSSVALQYLRHVLAMNANNGNAVEISPSGRQLAKVTLVPKGSGDLFAAAIATGGQGLLFVYDGTNALDLAKTR